MFQIAGAFRIRERERLRLKLRIEHRTAPHLFPVVILGVDPEDRHYRNGVLCRRPFAELDRGDGLEEGEERTAECARLLSGRDDNRARIGELRASFTRAWRRAATFLLRCNDGRDSGSVPTMRLGSSDGTGPRLIRRGIAGIQVSDILEIERVFPKKRTHPFERAYVDAGRDRLVRSTGRCRRAEGL